VIDFHQLRYIDPVLEFVTEAPESAAAPIQGGER
jgi:hypothetical protein